ncbi:MAG: multidrug ABC transporter permease [Planctomycetota bacterium]|nr:MAG: multidrug ABC transporter permease [Planctomycetota bacterium]
MKASPMGIVQTLCSREIMAFLRQPSRVLSALMTPVLFWVIFGAGIGRSFRPTLEASEGDFLTYFFPGILGLSVVFSGIFSAITTILDRQKGFLQSVLVVPGPRMAIVAGKVLGGALLALLQGAILLLLAPLAGLELTFGSFLLAVLVLALLAFAMTAMGFWFAWKIDSVQGFHGVMNLLFFPLWLLSGALFPAGGAYAGIRWIMTLNPLHYGDAALRHALYVGKPLPDGLPSMTLCFVVIGATALFMLFIASRAIHRGRDRA